MKRSRRVKITPAVLGYAAFAAAAFILFLYLRFPGDVLIRNLSAAAADVHPDCLLLIDSAKPAIPPGVAFTNVTLGLRSRPRSSLQADTVTLRPAYRQIFSGGTGVAFAAVAYGGTIRGQADTNHFLSFRGPVRWHLTADGIDVAGIDALKDRMGRPVSGQFKGDLTASGRLPTFSGMAGSLEFTLVNGSCPLPKPVMGFDRLDFKSVEALAQIKNGILTIRKFRLTGERVSGTLSGTITLDTADINRSEINLNGSVELPPDNKKITVLLTGPLGNPRIRYL